MAGDGHHHDDFAKISIANAMQMANDSSRASLQLALN